jgi:uncharacterized protein
MAVTVKRVDLVGGNGAPVEAAFYGPGEVDLGVVLAHGTSGNLSHPLVAHFAHAFAKAGISALTFNFPYRQRGEDRRDEEGVLEDSVRRAAEWLMRELAIDRLVLGGKSLGARMSSQVVGAGFPAAGLLFLGYPLHPLTGQWNCGTLPWHGSRVRCASCMETLTDSPILRCWML